MFFITNRVMTGNPKSLTFKASNEISQSLIYCRLGSGKSISEVGSPVLMKGLKESGSKEILFYIHGFSNQPFKDIFPRARAIQSQLNAAGLTSFEVVPIIWPCDDDFNMIKDYWDDQESSEQSGRFFSRAISKLLKWQEDNKETPCLKRMHVLAHSMGGRFLMKGLSFWADRFGGGGVPYLFRNVFLMASDIPNESLEPGEEGWFITQAAQRVICYYANDDFAMPASKAANVKNGIYSRRLGMSGPEDMNQTPKNVYAVNCDSFNNKFDLKGHSYFVDKKNRKSPAFQHVIKALKTKGEDLGKRSIVI